MWQSLSLTSGLLSLAAFPLSVWPAFARRLEVVRDHERRLDGTGLEPDAVLSQGRDYMVDLRSIVRGLRPLARMNFVEIELAMACDSDCWVSSGVGCRVIEETIASAIRSAPCGTVLVTARSIGGKQHIIRVTDDGEAAVRPARDMAALDLGRLVAQIGGSMVMEAGPGVGATVTVCLPYSLPLDVPAQPINWRRGMSPGRPESSASFPRVFDSNIALHRARDSAFGDHAPETSP